MAGTSSPKACRQFRRLLKRHSLGQLTIVQQERFEEHYLSCASCRFDQIEAINEEDEDIVSNRLLYYEALTGVQLH